jgi:uncharacterized protein YlaI
MEKRIELKPVEVRLYCDTCKEEMIEDKSKILLSNPPIRTYVCKGGHSVTTPSIYPRIDFDKLSVGEMFARIF